MKSVCINIQTGQPLSYELPPGASCEIVRTAVVKLVDPSTGIVETALVHVVDPATQQPAPQLPYGIFS